MNENDHDDTRVALVSGGSRGIGAAVTTALTQRGCRVGCTYRTGRDDAEKLAADAPEQVLPIRFDLHDDTTAPTAVERVVTHWGHLDSLVLNAGQWSGGRLVETDPDAWWSVIETNLRGTVALARAALPHLAHGRSPSIVLVSSVVGLIGHPGDTAYAGAKSAMIGFGRSLAKEVARDGIRVNVLAPGFVTTDMTDAVPDSARRRIERETVLGRFGTVDEIAKAAVFLSEDATFCTGSVLTVDGGWAL
ncbi:3-oxoacyl-[acyl-carrier protein] reductase [Rhodococcus wratislaviensis]|uniref:3-oxoacyl-ACP reductase n=2 Tax=Rhodococcus wratislaviensis TaxID=44752 RepID=A0AB38F7Z8_RHOWR|nr:MULTISPECIES: SDR family oxidoreductase [Rhodococcus]REE76581.1 3-oxoacyl-[acyl-carrier protein] reductase [Rhodococcus wratislaviensis]WAM13731.1 SDR family oxidoreductase [Rhodococcus sp. JS3073]SPZ35984.1 3-oxoacyl-ACP reductase [Rhodococcus wratislaviensis]